MDPNNISNTRASIVMRRNMLNSMGNSSSNLSTHPPLVRLQTSNPSAGVEQKLADRFFYFKEEFLNVANILSIAVPLDLVEDRSSLVQPFMQSNGPKYVFEILQGKMDNVQLMRSGLSLLIVTIAILRRVCPDTPRQGKHLDRSWHQQGFGNDLIRQFGATVDRAWAHNALLKYADSVSVNGCISILLGTHNLVIQELVLNLLAGLIGFSEDSILQMLQTPNIFNRGPSGNANNSNTNSNTLTSNSLETDKDRGVSFHLKRLNSRMSLFDGTDSRRGTASSVGGGNIDLSKYNFNRLKVVTQEMDPANAYKEEYQSCLSFILTIVLIQKNRHLLLAACVDIIVAMTNNASSQLCEVIARSPTCSIPINYLDKSLSSGHSLKHLYANNNNNQKSLTINPLGNKVLEWAGIKLPLKFLQKYHTMFEPNNSDSKKKKDSDHAINDSYISNQLKEEYLYTHNRSLLAVAALIAGSPTVTTFVFHLPGAVELLSLSSNVFSKGKDDNLPGIIVNALNCLQLEKQRQKKLKNQQSVGSVSNISNGTLSSNDSFDEEDPFQPKRSISPGTPKGGNSSSNKRESTTKTQKLRPITVSSSAPGVLGYIPPPLGSPPKKAVLSDSVKLVGNINKDFNSEYQVETETGKLHLMKSYDKKVRERGPASDFQQTAANKMRSVSAGPLQAQSSVDTLLNNSLEAIDQNAQESLLNPSKTPKIPTNKESLFFLSQSTPSLHLESSSMTTNENPNIITDPQTSPSATVDAYRNFFCALPLKPILPRRIEPEDIIQKNENLDKIRQKFQLLAETAVSKIKHKGVMRNGKSTVNIEERARRVYSPKRTSPTPWLPNSSARPLSGTTPNISSLNKLEPLNFIDDNLLDIKTPRNKNLQAFSEDPNDNQNQTISNQATPAWHSRPQDPAYYGIRLDNVEFEEQNLFENFRPIFDYNNSQPEEKQRQKSKKTLGGDKSPRELLKATMEPEQTNDAMP